LVFLKDFFNNGSISQRGLGLMAFYGCFSTSFFNIVFGFVINTFKELLKNEKDFVSFNIFHFFYTYDRLILFLLIYVVFHCLFLLLLFFFFNFEFDKSSVKYFVILYFIFLFGLLLVNYLVGISVKLD
jgi:hypothetical protein